MKTAPSFVLSLSLTVILCAQPLGAQTHLGLTFGVYTTDKPTDMYRQFKPALLYLESYLSTRFSRPVEITLHIYRSYAEARDALVAGESVDFARFGPASYILAREQALQKSKDIVLLAMEKEEGGTTFQGVIFTRTDTGITKLEDLRGKRFAFADKSSTIGRYISQALLAEKGISGKDLAYEYFERHDQVVSAVLAGKFDAGAVKESTFNKFKEKGLTVLRRFDNVTKPWVARGDIDPEIATALREALLALEDQKVLEALGGKVTGFGASKDADYNDTRRWMKKAEQFAPEEDEASSSAAN